MFRSRALQTFRYRPELDGLRALAVLTVWAHHSLNAWAPGGFAGVDVFFAISGYLITALLLAEWTELGGLDLKRFYARRALRLFPALWCMVAAYVAMAWWFPSIDHVTRRGVSVAVVLGYSSNWVTALGVHPLGALEHTWSLATEEQFYLLWPPLLWLLLRARSSPTRIALGVLAFGALAAAWRCWLVARGAQAPRVYFGLETRLDALLLGCVLALVMAGKRVELPRWAATLTSVLGVLGVACVILRTNPRDPRMMGVGYSAVGVTCALLLLGVLASPASAGLNRVLALAPLRYLGRASYAFYLWHQPVNFLFPLDGGSGRAAAVSIRFVLTLALAVATHELVERPLERFRRYLRPGPGPALVAASEGIASDAAEPATPR